MTASGFADRLGAAARRPASWWQLLIGIVGGSGYLINLAVFEILAGSLGIHHTVAAIGAFCVAVTSNFLWNRYWTFGPGDGPAGFPILVSSRSASPLSASTWACWRSSSPVARWGS